MVLKPRFAVDVYVPHIYFWQNAPFLREQVFKFYARCVLARARNLEIVSGKGVKGRWPYRPMKQVKTQEYPSTYACIPQRADRRKRIAHFWVISPVGLK
jgi:hypothetical protein